MELTRESFIKTKELYNQAQEYVPGGVQANIKYFDPHPIFMEKASGSKLYDVDGNKYIDYLLANGSLILGHGHQVIVDAVSNSLSKLGTAIFGTPHELEIVMSKKLIDLYPGIEMVRFTNSGLEATLLAIRTAIAFTGKSKIAKFEGHYHGGHDQVLLSVNPDLEKAGLKDSPKPVADSRGVPDYFLENTIILPFNNIEATERILRENAENIAAVILEPIEGGFIPADKLFMSQLRKITEELDILLVFDEVKTGFRIALGGAQEYYGIKPDLTTLGKVLGGGFPIGAIGGKRDIMSIMAPNGGKDTFSISSQNKSKSEVLFHSGTYNGHPTVLSAGLATIQYLEQNGELTKLIDKTNCLRRELEKLYLSFGLAVQTIGLGTIFNILITEKRISNYRDMYMVNNGLRKQIDNELLNSGIYLKPLGRYSLSTAHSEEDIDKTIEIHKNALIKVLK